MSFSDGGGEPSTQPFHPLRAAGRFFLSLLMTGPWLSTLWPRSVISSPSSGVYGRFEDVADVREEMDGPGVVGGDEGMGGGENEAER